MVEQENDGSLLEGSDDLPAHTDTPTLETALDAASQALLRDLVESSDISSDLRAEALKVLARELTPQEAKDFLQGGAELMMNEEDGTINIILPFKAPQAAEGTTPSLFRAWMDSVGSGLPTGTPLVGAEVFDAWAKKKSGSLATLGETFVIDLIYQEPAELKGYHGRELTEDEKIFNNFKSNFLSNDPESAHLKPAAVAAMRLIAAGQDTRYPKGSRCYEESTMLVDTLNKREALKAKASGTDEEAIAAKQRLAELEGNDANTDRLRRENPYTFTIRRRNPASEQWYAGAKLGGGNSAPKPICFVTGKTIEMQSRAVKAPHTPEPAVTTFSSRIRALTLAAIGAAALLGGAVAYSSQTTDTTNSSAVTTSNTPETGR